MPDPPLKRVGLLVAPSFGRMIATSGPLDTERSHRDRRACGGMIVDRPLSNEHMRFRPTAVHPCVA